jgi:hypothetical protein
MTKPYDIVGNTHDDDAVLDDIASDTMGWKTLMAVLRSLERQGLIERRLGENGQPLWRITAKGKSIEPDDIGEVELRDFPLD